MISRTTLQSLKCIQSRTLIADIGESACGVSEPATFALGTLGRLAADEFQRGANFLTGDSGLPRAFSRRMPAVKGSPHRPGHLLLQETDNLFLYSPVRLESECHPARCQFW